MAHILVVDDEVSMREFLEILLRKSGHTVECMKDGAEALARIGDGADEVDLVITDLKMPRVTGLEVLERVKQAMPDTEVVVMTAFSTTETAIEAMKKGAYDYIGKPFKVDQIKVVVDKCIEKRRLAVENRRLHHLVREKFRFENIVGRSPAIRQVFEMIERVALTRTNVLISGETGTGKELVAKAIHFNSPRKDKPFLVINCGAIPAELMESELFGHIKGAFTGAYTNKKGLFEEADGGTLFLDEIGELTLPLQVKLLRALQERKIKQVGGVRELDVDVRIIAATNRDLEDEVRRDRFRQDLYFRLNVIQIRMPALRDRRDDIPLIAQHLLQKLGKDLGKHLRGIEPRAMDALIAYPFAGNVRELENLIERAVTFEMSDVLTVSSLPEHVVAPPRTLGPMSGPGRELELPDSGVDLEGILADVEKRYLLKALEQTGGNKTDAAKRLGVSFRSIRYKLAKFGIAGEDGSDG